MTKATQSVNKPQYKVHILRVEHWSREGESREQKTKYPRKKLKKIMISSFEKKFFEVVNLSYQLMDLHVRLSVET